MDGQGISSSISFTEPVVELTATEVLWPSSLNVTILMPSDSAERTAQVKVKCNPICNKHYDATTGFISRHKVPTLMIPIQMEADVPLLDLEFLSSWRSLNHRCIDPQRGGPGSCHGPPVVQNKAEMVDRDSVAGTNRTHHSSIETAGCWQARLGTQFHKI